MPDTKTSPSSNDPLKNFKGVKILGLTESFPVNTSTNLSDLKLSEISSEMLDSPDLNLDCLQDISVVSEGRVKGLSFIANGAEKLGTFDLLEDPLNLKKSNAISLRERYFAAINAASNPGTYNKTASNPEFIRAFGMQGDAIYELTGDPNIDWDDALLMAAIRLAKKVFKHTRRLYLLIDDTSYERRDAKEAEGIASMYDHVNQNFYLGYGVLTIALTDGNTTIPLTMSLLSSADRPIRRGKRGRPSKSDPIICENSSKRRNEFRTEAEGTYAHELKDKMQHLNKFERCYGDLKLVVEELKKSNLLKKIVSVCSDSWFNSCSEFRQQILSLGLRFTGALKNSLTRYKTKKNGTPLGIISMKAIAADAGKTIKQDPEAIEEYKVSPCNGNDSKHEYTLVCTANNSHNASRPILPILDSDLDASKEDVIETYGKRVLIESLFRVLKHAWQLIKGSQARKVNCINAHIHLCSLLFLYSILWLFEHTRNDKNVTSYTLADKIETAFLGGLMISDILGMSSLLLQLRKRQISQDEYCDAAEQHLKNLAHLVRGFSFYGATKIQV